MNLAPTLDFLRELALNNNKAWFDANKKRYDEVRKQFLEVVGACIREMDKNLKLPPLQPKDCVFRIYRDVRFSKDKTPYKINMSFVISPEGKDGEVIDGVYVHVQPGNSFVGIGVYAPEADALKKIRQEIDFNTDKWLGIVNDAAFKKGFGEVKGEKLKTSPKGYEATHPAIEWLRNKQFFIMHPLTDAEMLSAKLPERVGEIFEKASDFRAFLKDALA